MKWTYVFALILLCASQCFGQRDEGAIWAVLEKLGKGEVGQPSLQDIFSDISQQLRESDPAKIKVLRARLAETTEEIEHLQNLKSTLDRGVLVQVPSVLRENLDVRASPRDVETAQRQLDAAKNQERFQQTKRSHPPGRVMQKKLRQALQPSASSMAALDIKLDLPEPSSTSAGADNLVRDSVDKPAYGKALYFAKDYQGTLKAYGQIPEEERSFEIQYRIARCHDLLGHWEEAAKAYGAVVSKDGEGYWGGQARFMLGIGSELQKIKTLMVSGNNKEQR